MTTSPPQHTPPFGIHSPPHACPFCRYPLTGLAPALPSIQEGADDVDSDLEPVLICPECGRNAAAYATGFDRHRWSREQREAVGRGADAVALGAGMLLLAIIILVFVVPLLAVAGASATAVTAVVVGGIPCMPTAVGTWSITRRSRRDNPRPEPRHEHGPRLTARAGVIIYLIAAATMLVCVYLQFDQRSYRLNERSIQGLAVWAILVGAFVLFVAPLRWVALLDAYTHRLPDRHRSRRGFLIHARITAYAVAACFILVLDAQLSYHGGIAVLPFPTGGIVAVFAVLGLVCSVTLVIRLHFTMRRIVRVTAGANTLETPPADGAALSETAPASNPPPSATRPPDRQP